MVTYCVHCAYSIDFTIIIIIIKYLPSNEYVVFILKLSLADFNLKFREMLRE